MESAEELQTQAQRINSLIQEAWNKIDDDKLPCSDEVVGLIVIRFVAEREVHVAMVGHIQPDGAREALNEALLRAIGQSIGATVIHFE